MARDPNFIEKAFQAERRIAGFRLFVVASGFILYPWLEWVDAVPGSVRWLAWSLLITAAVYGVYVWLAEPYRRFPALLSAYFLSVTDSAFTMLWLYATGGFHSPFYVAVYLAIVAVAFRFRWRETAFATAAYAGLYVVMVATLGQLLPNLAEVAVRVAYFGLAALMGAVVSNEVLDQTRAKATMESRLQETQRSEMRIRQLLAAIRRQERMLAESQALAHLGSWEWDVAADRVTWSDELYRIYGLTRSEFRASFEGVVERIHPSDRDHVRQTVEETMAIGTRFDVDHRIVRPDGAVRWLHARGHVDRGEDGTIRRMRGTAQDVTDQKAAEQEAERARQQRAEIQRLEELNEFKTGFLNVAAHELSTPLTPLRIQLTVLRDHFDDLTADERRSAIRVLDRSVDRVIQLVGDLLETARLQAGNVRLELEEVRLHEAVEECVASFTVVAAQHGVRLEAEGPPERGTTVRVDRKRLGQILDNLVSNAIKFTPDGGTVLIGYGLDGHDAWVEVRDSGIGMTREQISRLFEPFSQVQAPVRPGAGGTGLGLFISRRFAELHGGTITAGSAGSGRGSTFRFHWPLAGPSAEPFGARRHPETVPEIANPT